MLDHVPSVQPRPTGQRRALVGIALSQLLVLTLWFSAAAVARQLLAEWGVSIAVASLLTLAVQIGFVVGAFTIAASGVADSVPSRGLFVIAPAWRSVSLSGHSQWAVKADSADEMRPSTEGRLAGASVLAGVGAVLMARTVTDGPFEVASAPFSVGQVGAALRNRGVRLSVGLGFLLTLVTVRGVPLFAGAFGWQWALPWLAIGSAAGIVAMLKLRSSKTVQLVT